LKVKENKMIPGHAFSALENRNLLWKVSRKVSLCQIGSDATDSEMGRNPDDNPAVASDLIPQVKRFPATGGLLGLTGIIHRETNLEGGVATRPMSWLFILEMKEKE